MVKLVDFQSLASVRQFAKEINETEDRLDILVNNAGIGGTFHRTTVDGYQIIIQVNHLAPFLLTNLLLGNNFMSISTIDASIFLCRFIKKICTK